MTSHLTDITARWQIDHSLRDMVPDITALEWQSVPGGIEADTGLSMIRVDADDIVITNKRFGSKIRIPLK